MGIIPTNLTPTITLRGGGHFYVYLNTSNINHHNLLHYTMKLIIQHLRSYLSKNQILSLSIFVLSGVLVSVGVVSAATTISTDISTGGSLSVTGTSTLLGNVGIGTTTPNNLLSVYDLVDFNNTDFNTKIGYQSGKYIVSGATNNTFLGYQAGLASSTATTNTADYNTGIGFNSIGRITTGFWNTAVGAVSMNSTTIGTKNTAIGVLSMASNTTGSANTAVGDESLDINSTGSYNTAIGQQALYLGTGSYNTAIGALNLRLQTTGNKNTALGYQAGLNITTASSSIIIGANVNAPSATVDGQLNIGNLIYGIGVYQGDVSSASPAAGNIGIGISNPTSQFQVASSTSNATTSIEIGKTGQNKGSCLVLYDAAGTAVYASVATGASTFTLSATSCK